MDELILIIFAVPMYDEIVAKSPDPNSDLKHPNTLLLIFTIIKSRSACYADIAITSRMIFMVE